MSLAYALTAARRRPRSPSGSASRRAFLVVGSVLAASALAMGTAQASQAAGVPAPGWNTYTAPLVGGEVMAAYAPSLDDAWAVGSTSFQGGGHSAYLRFNGTAWSSVSGPDIGDIAVIGGTSDSDVWVLGTDSTAHYDGSHWTTYAPDVPSGTTYIGSIPYAAPTQVYVASPDDAWAEMPMQVSSSPEIVDQVLEHFDGTGWSLMTDIPGISAGSGQVQDLTGSGPDDVYLVWDSNDGNSELMHFNGTAWAVVTLPKAASGSPVSLVNMNVTGAGDGLVLGYDTNDPKPYAAQLTNGTWSLAALPSPSTSVWVNPTSGTGRVWTQTETSAGADGPSQLWEWSGGKWQQITDNAQVLSTAIADGSGLWSYGYDDNASGGSGNGFGAARLELYDAG